MRYSVSKNLIGLYTVKFECPNCNVSLSSPLKDAGNTDYCPDCGTEFVVPGKKEKQKAAKVAADKNKARQQARDKKSIEKQQAADKRKATKIASQQASQEAKAAAERERKEQLLSRQRQQQEAEQYRRQAALQPVPCPYCDMQVQRGSKKCGHCGEWLVSTGHSDALAGVLALFFGPVGLWYKGHWAAGFAWLASGIFILGPLVAWTCGVGIIFAPVFWLGMIVHAATVPGRH